MSKNKTIKVALIGDLCLDLFLHIPDYPQKGGDGLAEKLVKQSGGSASNTAIALAHLGCEPYLFTHTGDDFWMQQLLTTLSQEGVRVDHIKKEKLESTGLTFLVVTPDGERTMFTYRGANALLLPEEITPEMFSEVTMLHLSGYACLKPPQSDAVWKAVDIACEKGIGISLDIGVEPAHTMGEKLLTLLPKLKLLILGEQEALAIADTSSVPDALDFIIAHGVEIIGLKLGKDGCLLATQDQRITIPGFKVKVVDTTGAGDAFSAAMIFGLCHNWSLEVTGLLANTVGALTATHWGAGTEMPSIPEIVQFLDLQKRNAGKQLPSIDKLIKLLHAD